MQSNNLDLKDAVRRHNEAISRLRELMKDQLERLRLEEAILSKQEQVKR